MEPYRPFVAKLVVEITDQQLLATKSANIKHDYEAEINEFLNVAEYREQQPVNSETERIAKQLELTKELKAKLLSIPTLEVLINGQRSPLMVAVGQTTASLAKCYMGEIRKIAYPEFN